MENLIENENNKDRPDICSIDLDDNHICIIELKKPWKSDIKKDEKDILKQVRKYIDNINIKNKNNNDSIFYEVYTISYINEPISKHFLNNNFIKIKNKNKYYKLDSISINEESTKKKNVFWNSISFEQLLKDAKIRNEEIFNFISKKNEKNE